MSHLASFVFALALCSTGLSACGGVARGDKQAAPVAGAPGVGGVGGANTTSVLSTAGTTNTAGGASTVAQAGASGVAGDQGSSAGAPADAGSFACGASTCTPSQLCVARQCGGGPVQCMSETDGGCPTGWHADLCPDGQFGSQSCVPDPCSPPAPECVDVPAACTAKLDCFCLNQGSVCLGPGCASIVGRQVTCNGAE